MRDLEAITRELSNEFPKQPALTISGERRHVLKESDLRSKPNDTPEGVKDMCGSWILTPCILRDSFSVNFSVLSSLFFGCVVHSFVIAFPPEGHHRGFFFNVLMATAYW